MSGDVSANNPHRPWPSTPRRRRGILSEQLGSGKPRDLIDLPAFMAAAGLQRRQSRSRISMRHSSRPPLSNGREVIVPVDHSKIGVVDFTKICEPREIDTVVTHLANDKGGSAGNNVKITSNAGGTQRRVLADWATPTPNPPMKSRRWPNCCAQRRERHGVPR